MADRGNARAIKELTEPTYPEDLHYLHQYYNKLSGQRAPGIDGPAPITPEAIGWANLMQRWYLSPKEVDALHFMDHVERNAEEYLKALDKAAAENDA